VFSDGKVLANRSEAVQPVNTQFLDIEANQVSNFGQVNCFGHVKYEVADVCLHFVISNIHLSRGKWRARGQRAPDPH
jgi:hypothetical protein